MIPDEVANVSICRGDTKPAGLGRTILARVPEGRDAFATMEQIRGAWAVISRWGTWINEELGEWPSTTECLEQLPEWLREGLSHEPSFEVENWMDGLHDREWVWWSGIVLAHHLKIDLSLDSSPISTWPMELVAEKAGASIIYSGDWRPSLEGLG